jgi:hypothetical protein
VLLAVELGVLLGVDEGAAPDDSTNRRRLRSTLVDRTNIARIYMPAALAFFF